MPLLLTALSSLYRHESRILVEIGVYLEYQYIRTKTEDILLLEEVRSPHLQGLVYHITFCKVIHLSYFRRFSRIYVYLITQ